MIDGFLGYNQISVDKQDRGEIAFTTPWGNFMYNKMPFGLMNAGATFQWPLQEKRIDLLSFIWMT